MKLRILVIAGFLAASVQQAGAAASRNTVGAVDQRAIQELIIGEARKMNFPPALALAVARVESDFNPMVKSHKGARGVMQIMPATALDEYGIEADLLWRPRINIRLGIHFLKRLLLRYRGRTDLALSYYNGGSRVGDLPNARVMPATRGYVNKVRRWQRHYRREMWRRTTRPNGVVWKSSRRPGESWKPERARN